MTTKQAAKLLNVSLRTIQLWTESGVLNAWKTAGGHRRISAESVNRMREEQVMAAGMSMSEAQPTIVIVEDDPLYRELYKLKIATWLPANVVTAKDGFEGLLMIGRLNPRLVITDLRMPGMDGFHMIRSLQGALAGVDIIVITGLSDGEIDQAGGLPRNVPVLRKPNPMDELESLLSNKLGLATEA